MANASKDATKSVTDLRGRFGRPRRTVPLYLDGEAVAEAAALEQMWQRAVNLDEQSNEPDRAPAIAKQVAEARERAEASLVEFELHAVSHRRWAQIIAENPPTEAQLAAAPVNAKPDYDIERVPGELVRAQLISPDPGTPEEWGAFWDELSDGQVRQLWGNAQILQLGDGSLGKSAIGSDGQPTFDGT